MNFIASNFLIIEPHQFLAHSTLPAETICVDLWKFILLIVLAFVVGCFLGWIKFH